MRLTVVIGRYRSIDVSLTVVDMSECIVQVLELSASQRYNEGAIETNMFFPETSTPSVVPIVVQLIRKLWISTL